MNDLLLAESPSTTIAGPWTIAIIGAGPVDTTLGRCLTNVGHNVTLSNSRGIKSLQEAARKLEVTAMDVRQAAAHADIIVLAVPPGSVTFVAAVVRDVIKPQCIILDACHYYPLRDGNIKTLDDGQPESVWVASHFTNVAVKAFNNITAVNIVTSAKPKACRERIAPPTASDDARAMETIARIIDEVGFYFDNAGSLLESWRFEPGQRAYCTESSMQQLPHLLARADQYHGPVSRDRSSKMMAHLPTGYPADTLVRVARLSAGLDKLNMFSWTAALQLAASLLRASVLGSLSKE